MWSVRRKLLALFCGTETEQRPGIKRLRFLIGDGSNPLVQDGGGSRSRSSSVVVAPQLAFGTTSITVKAVHSSQFAAVLPEPEPEASHLPWSSLPVSHRDGVSRSFLLAILLEAWRVPDDIATHQLCDKYVKPACHRANCGFLGVIMKTKCPEKLFGLMNIYSYPIGGATRQKAW